MQALAVMCTAVRWCCCRLFLLSRRYPHGEHHARDIANTPETLQFVGTRYDTRKLPRLGLGLYLSIPTRGSAGCSTPLPMLYSSVLPQQKKLGGGRKVEKVPPAYYCTSAGHHVLGKKCVFIAGSFLKESVFKAGTTVPDFGRTARVL